MYPGTWAQERPDHPAIIMAASGQATSYGQLDAQSNRLARLMRARGLVAGDHIALFLHNDPRFLEVTWAAQRSGLYWTPVGSHLTADEAAYVVNDCGARVIVTSAQQAGVAHELRERCPGVQTFLMLDQAAVGFELYDAAIAEFAGTRLPDEQEGMHMTYSSGTTGRPKGILRPLPNAPAGTPDWLLHLLTRLYDFGPDSVYLSPAPLYHSAPCRFSMTVQRLGGTVVIMDKFDPVGMLEVIERYRITHVQVVPTMFVRVLKLDESTRRRYDHSSLRAVIHAAAPCPIEVKRALIDWWGPIIQEYYAASEGNGYCAVNSEEWLTHPGSVGRCLLGEAHVLDDDGRELPTGQDGTIWFANSPAFAYHNDPHKTAESHNDRGWSTVCDIGHIDGEGYVYLTDRKTYMIVSGGVNIYPQEIENLLVEHPKVMDAAVFGVPNPEFGEEVKAVVQPVDIADVGPHFEAELIDYCRQHLAGYKCPRSVEFKQRLPRLENGKLYKSVLRDTYWAGRASRIV
jgi:acyl-CoA synthetase (AMP-forming)/AMP-acid ligase II